ncbi:hypothetical protein [Butyrivibrio sp. NC3005]|uniref:hypothetical protein n=1 Tax=Butyrivibrio sp. NC3005 TaxID=1280685 RepID=UPI0003FCF639|nr:hypothetical protein [Butyrivibrio sp. NC3005]
MKRRVFGTKAAVVCLGIMIAASTLAGCSSKKTEDAAKEEVTITFMRSDKTLGQAKAAKGEVLDKGLYESYEKSDDAEFNGWFETPTFVAPSKKDLTKDTFDSDTTLYGDFRAQEAKEDTRHWYIAGTSEKGILKSNNWAGKLSDEEKKQFELVPTGKNKNEFSLTIDFEEGDQFQVIPDWSWEGQKGFGKFTQIDENDAENAGGLDASKDKSNVQIKTAGNYTITLTTNPDNPAQDTLTLVRNK